MKIQLPLLLAFATFLAPLSAHAATFNVPTTADAGVGSLRQAVLDANATTDDDTITFGVSGPITLTSGQLIINNSGSLAINGPAAGVAISGNNASRIFNVASSAIVTMSNLTLLNGNSAAQRQ